MRVQDAAYISRSDVVSLSPLSRRGISFAIGEHEIEMPDRGQKSVPDWRVRGELSRESRVYPSGWIQ